MHHLQGFHQNVDSIFEKDLWLPFSRKIKLLEQTKELEHQALGQ